MIRIYGTLGPACDKAETLEEMLNLGMTGLRLNLSHVSLREAAGELRHLREAEARCGKQAELLIDMQGPELRIGKLPSPLLFRAGETVDLDALPFPEAVRAALNEAGCGDVRLLAKVESREGMEKLPELLDACDEIVIARGDLGNAMPLWELPAAQKRIAAACRSAGRDFMVVTQMLASMEQNPVPTRAEVSDIFNAVLDGAASVMVTGETAAGKYPVEAIRYLTETVNSAERYLREERTTE